ncbi:hypothetical protein VNPA131289_27860 [Pseudomonas aeruginosa]|nr:hypothetical protein VNPA131289_27860 [Pseudomonas aeruginosa]GLF27667.1 hypothetical protein VNPA141486_22670 [Pseudomonas aeruginosa]GLF51921.1 hypothetical protein VNPA141818_24240 [Pseudomonas aeruginosa]
MGRTLRLLSLLLSPRGAKRRARNVHPHYASPPPATIRAGNRVR